MHYALQEMELEEFAATERKIERECNEGNSHLNCIKGNSTDMHQTGSVGMSFEIFAFQRLYCAPETVFNIFYSAQVPSE